MAIYELRTYTLYVGKLAEAIEHYQNTGWPALEKYQDYLVGYFTGDVGGMNQVVHMWKFADEAERRKVWADIYADPGFQAFASKFRPLIMSQENKFLLAAPWGPHP